MSVDVPVSIWQENSGATEFSNVGVDNIVDPSGTFLVDPSGVFIVDTGVLRTPIPATVWVERDDL